MRELSWRLSWQLYRREVAAEVAGLLAGRHFFLFDMVRYHLGWEGAEGAPPATGDFAGTPDGPPPSELGGKLSRPLLCLLCCRAVGGDYRRALPAAAAVELLHNFSLVHDDIQDRSPSRHHRPTVWQKWGEGQAINVGDSLFALAHLAAQGLEQRGATPGQVLEVLALLDEAALALCEGQVRDLDYEERAEIGPEEYLEMARAKTGALMEAAAASGALLGQAPGEAVAAFRRFGEELGIAFQIQDDILGLWGDPQVTGKPVGNDLGARKKGYPLVYALAHASPADRELLRGPWVAPATGAPEAQLLAALEASGARQQARQAVEDYRRRALGRLEGLALADSGRQELEAFTLYLLSAEV